MKTVSWKCLVIIVMLLLLYSASDIAAQNCSSSIMKTTPTERFSDNGDGTFTDMITGLMWKSCSEGQTGDACSGSAKSYSWQAALQQAQTVNSGGGYAGYSDWRVPNINELMTIVEFGCFSPTINLSVFPGTASSYYWSSTPYEGGNTSVWCIDFYYGKTADVGKTPSSSTLVYLRLVRGGN